MSATAPVGTDRPLSEADASERLVEPLDQAGLGGAFELVLVEPSDRTDEEHDHHDDEAEEETPKDHGGADEQRHGHRAHARSRAERSYEPPHRPGASTRISRPTVRRSVPRLRGEAGLGLRSRPRRASPVLAVSKASPSGPLAIVATSRRSPPRRARRPARRARSRARCDVWRREPGARDRLPEGGS